MSKNREITYVINQVSGCWECNSHAPDSHGYPRFKKNIKIFRHMYATHKGPIPNGLLVRHTCDNRLCINPDHLLLGTVADNVKDMIERGRHVIISNRKTSPEVFNAFVFGHPQKLTSTQVIEIRNSSLGERKLSKIYGVCCSTIRK